MYRVSLRGVLQPDQPQLRSRVGQRTATDPKLPLPSGCTLDGTHLLAWPPNTGIGFHPCSKEIASTTG